MPDVGPGAALRRAAKAEAPAEALEGTDAAPDETLIAPLEECSVCLNGFERPTITPCAHWFCRRVQSSGHKLPCFEALPGPCRALAHATGRAHVLHHKGCLLNNTGLMQVVLLAGSAFWLWLRREPAARCAARPSQSRVCAEACRQQQSGECTLQRLQTRKLWCRIRGGWPIGEPLEALLAAAVSRGCCLSPS